VYNSNLPTGETADRTLDELLETAEGRERQPKSDCRSLETGIAARAEMRIAYGGRKHYYDVAIDPVLDSAGAVVGLTGVRIDVTELRETTEAFTRSQAKLTEENYIWSRKSIPELGFGEIVDGARLWQAVMGNVRTVASTDATVLRWAKPGR